MTKTGNRYLGAALRGLVLAVVVAGVTVLVTGRVLSDDKKPADKPAKKEAPGFSPAMMAEWLAMNAPGEYHEHLKQLVGQWNGECGYCMMPGQEPQMSKATMTSELMFGGKFLKQHYKGLAAGMPFEGIGCFGYDNFKKKYTSIWIDSMTTGIYSELGSCDESGKVFTMSGMMDDCMIGKSVKMQSVLTIISADKHKFVMSKPGPDGKMFQHMEIVYTRKK
jgi:hypothetical protein